MICLCAVAAGDGSLKDVLVDDPMLVLALIVKATKVKTAIKPFIVIKPFALSKHSTEKHSLKDVLTRKGRA